MGTMLTGVPVTWRDASEMLGEAPVGYRALTVGGPLCTQECLAPGSSPHSHSTVQGWEVYGTRTGVRLSPNGEIEAQFTLHTWGDRP